MNELKFVHDIATDVASVGGRTFYVGGCVRDKLLGLESKDIDIEVYGITPDVLVNDILNRFGQVRLQGATFGVYRVAGYDVDIAFPRAENNVGKHHKDFTVSVDPDMSYEKATSRRDFTINAILEDVLTGEIIDCYGGQDDLKNKIIRHVNANSFVEDALRVFRAAQFAARFGFDIDVSTKALMRGMDVMFLSKECVYEEMKKAMLLSPKPSRFFEELKDVNQLNFWFSEILALYGCEQNPMYHPEGDVWVHTMQTLDYAVNCRDNVQCPECFMLAVLCHDIGKPITSHTDVNGAIHAYRHEAEGVPVGRTFLHRITDNNFVIKYVLNMIELHMDLPKMFSHDSRIKKSNALFDKSICGHDLIYLSYCDTYDDWYYDDFDSKSMFLGWCQKRLEVYEYYMTLPQVTGEDLISLGLQPSPLFSELLQKAHRLHLSCVDKDTVLRGFVTELRKKKLI